MFSKLVKALFRETTNTKDISSATFNTSGTYNPRYGKQKVYVTGKAGDGSTSPGYDYYNTVPGVPSSPTPPTPGTVNPYIPASSSPASTNWGGFAFQSRGNPPAYTVQNPPMYGSGSQPASYYTYYNTYYNNGDYDWVHYYNTYTPASGGNTNPPTANPPNTAYNPTYPYAGTYSPYFSTGTNMNVLGVTFPGGYGGTAPTVSSTLTNNVPNYGTSYTVTVPTGGYVTITFTL